MKYFYLGKDTSWGRERYPIPTVSFKAIKVKNPKNGKNTFIPVIETDCNSQNKLFCERFGWIRLTGKKTYDIPVYDGDPEKWKDYFQKYGARCLYYSINGKGFTNDCCNLKEINEFLSLCSSKVEKYPAFVESFERMNEIQEKVLDEKFDGTDLLKGEREKMLFRPCHSVLGFAFPFTANPVEDDKRLEAFWWAYRKKDVPFPVRYTKGFIDLVSHELNSDNDTFPTSVSDRIRMIYGEECERIYSETLNIVS